VAGGIPIIKTMRESLAGNEIRRVYGILNGTCNYILTTMQKEGRPFADILRDAQQAGYAEADPTFDIGGFDTAHKLAILTSLAFGTEPAPDEIYIEGIERIGLEDIQAADELGYRIKLLGVALRTDSGIEQRVHPTMVPKHTALAEVDHVTNCVAIAGDFVGDILLIGAGAGAGPTASAVIGDVVDIAWGVRLPPLLRRAELLRPYERARMRAHQGGYYIRLLVKDHPGAFAAIAGRMAEKGISLKSIMQKGGPGKAPVRSAAGVAMAAVVMITHETSESAVREALALITGDGHVDADTRMIRIEAL
jgi:homoserine dehydrogenase